MSRLTLFLVVIELGVNFGTVSSQLMYAIKNLSYYLQCFDHVTSTTSETRGR